jgi:hypothetical protein
MERSCEVPYKPFAKAWSRYPKKCKRISPLCTGALAPAWVGSGPNAGCCAGVSLALSCALVRVIATNLGARGDGASIDGREDGSPELRGPERRGQIQSMDCGARVSWPRVARGHRPRLNYVMRSGGTPVGKPTR